jgi:hypothetical protein
MAGDCDFRILAEASASAAGSGSGYDRGDVTALRARLRELGAVEDPGLNTRGSRDDVTAVELARLLVASARAGHVGAQIDDAWHWEQLEGFDRELVRLRALVVEREG